jgi:hypothetical protein
MGKRILTSILIVVCFYTYVNTQQTATVVVSAQPQQVLILRIDGTDPGWGGSTNEICDLGNLDARGTPILGAPSGDPDVNGIVGIPVDSAGVPLSSPNDPGCIGAFYPIFSATGGNFWLRHPNSAIAIRIWTLWERWNLTVSAQLTTHTQNVTIGQLKWKDDLTSVNGYQGYTDFSTSNILIASGIGFRLFYHDYGLLVEYEDEPGTNIWRITYTLTSI